MLDAFQGISIFVHKCQVLMELMPHPQHFAVYGSVYVHEVIRLQSYTCSYIAGD